MIIDIFVLKLITMVMDTNYNLHTLNKKDPANAGSFLLKKYSLFCFKTRLNHRPLTTAQRE